MRPSVLVAVAVAACSFSAPMAGEPLVEGVSVRVEVVSDGDSFRGGDLEVRLLGVNAPELAECYGEESASWLERSVAGATVEVLIKDTDQFGRSLADVFHDDLWVNQELVGGGYGLALQGNSELIAAAEEAIAAGVGMWAADICGADTPKAKLEIVDVLFDPPGSDEDEQVTIRNIDTVDVDLDGFTLRDESSVNRLRLPSFTLRPGSEVVVSTACRSGTPMIFWCSSGPVWNNDGDTALLLDHFGRVVALHRYP